MIDFVKCRIEGYGKKSESERIIFPSLHDPTTGQLLKQESEEVLLRNMILKPLANGNAWLSGSLHKYYNSGLNGFSPKGRSCYNYDDFTYSSLCNSINAVCEEVQIVPEEMKLMNMEIGVNINVPIPVSIILNSVVMRKGKTFSNSRSTGKHFRECELSRFYIKMYDKGLQAKSGKCLLRYELKFMNMDYLNRDLKMEVKTLHDLTNKDILSALGSKLASSLNDIVFSDASINESKLNRREQKIYLQGSNPNWWVQQYEAGKGSVRRFKKTYLELIKKYGQLDFGNMIELRINEKWKTLLK